MVSIVYRLPTWRWFNDELLCDDATLRVHYLVYLHRYICITIINRYAYTSAKWYSFNTRTCSRSLCLFTIIEQPIVSKTIYTWKKVLQHPNFFLLTKLCYPSVLLLTEIYSKLLAHRKTHFTFKKFNLMLYNS
jgi:hypothetical protein